MSLFPLCLVLLIEIIVIVDVNGRLRYQDIYDLETCNIDQEFEWISQAEFDQRYVQQDDLTKPVVFRRAPLKKYFLELLEIDNVLRRYGNRSITVTSANTYSYKKQSMKIIDYVNLQISTKKPKRWGNESVYWFGDDLFNDQQWLQKILRYYEPPPYVVKDFVQRSLSFGMAGQGTGVPFHFHGPGFQQMIRGRKRWYLSVKRPFFDPNETTIHWAMEKNLDRMQPFLYECTLHPGDVIYFPNLWWHATLNLDFGLFISTFLSL